MEEEERDKAIEDRPSYPVSAVYADESGKTAEHLIVGSMWILNGFDTLGLANAVRAYKLEKSFKDEFHFSEINERRLASASSTSR